MRKLAGSVACLGLAGLLVVPLFTSASGWTLSTSPATLQDVTLPAIELRDEAAMVLVGTVLLAVAAAVRRSV